MILTDDREQFFEMRITGYEFPEDPDPPDGDSWVIVHVRYRDGSLAREFTDPALMVREVVELADCFDQLAVEPFAGELTRFIEPVLDFSVIGEPGRLRLVVALDVPVPTLRSPLFAFPLDRIDLRAAARVLREDLAAL